MSGFAKHVKTPSSSLIGCTFVTLPQVSYIMDNLFLLIPFSVVVVALTRHFIRSTKRSPNHPPGPKPWPIIGNALDIPSAKAWEVYSSWCRSYGQDLCHLQVLGQHMMIVNSRELTHELFEKRSLIYSDRPFVPMIELMGWGDNGFAFMPYGETWRQHRQLFQAGFRHSTAEYRPIQLEKTHKLLINLLKDPDNFRAHIRTLAAATIMGIIYGHDVVSTDGYFVDLVEKANETLLTLGTNTATLVNLFPFMRYLPEWLPGCQFHGMAREARRRINDVIEKPYSFVVDEINSGTHGTSLLATYLDWHETNNDDEQDLMMIKQVCGLAYAGAADTTVSPLATFFLAMATHPHVQKKAQAHIDDLLGESRLPTMEDRSQLQYIEAIMRELFRWHPVSPLGVYHSTSGEDIVNGYLVPKGTIISGNIWAMTRDPNVYPNPEKFIPERFLEEDGGCNNDDMSYTFGFGRRICPGRHLATDTIWIAVVSILATFDIGRAKDEAGNVIELDGVAYTEGLAVQPLPFPCTITARSDRARALLADLVEQM